MLALRLSGKRVGPHSLRLACDGVTALEYAFVASIISISAIGSFHVIGGWLGGVFDNIAVGL